MDFGHRLKNFRLERGMTQQELADAVNASVVGVRNWERGSRKPTMDMLLALGHALDISIDTLLDFSVTNQSVCPLVLSPAEKSLLMDYQSLDHYGKKTVETVCALEKERIDALARKAATKVIDFQAAKSSSERFIPRYISPSAAGFNVPLDGDEFEMILVNDSVPDDADFAVNIQGNSMSPYISDGEMVYVKKDAELSIGDVGIFCVDGAMYCKQYYLDDENNLILVSANPELRSANVFVAADSGSSVKFCGKVLLNQHIELPDYLFED